MAQRGLGSEVVEITPNGILCKVNGESGGMVGSEGIVRDSDILIYEGISVA